MRPAPPIVEDRTLPGIRRLDPGQDPVAELAREVRSRLGLADDAGLGPGDALSAIAWRLAEIAIARVNGIPERNLLAFLELIGVRRLPPQAARTALSFALAPGASGRPLLPAGVQVAGSPLGDETEPVVFETDDPLVLTPRVKTAVIVHQPDADRWSDRGLGEGDEPFAAFGGADPIAHDLYVTHPMLGAPGQKSIELRAATSDMASLGNLPLRVAEWDGTEWRKLSHRASTPGPGVAALSVAHADAPAPVEVDGLTAPWLRVRLNTPLPASTSADGATDRVERSGLAPDAIAVGSAPARVDAVIDAFGRAADPEPLHLASDEPFLRAGATVEIDFELERLGAGAPAIELAWEWFDGSRWIELGRSTPSAPTAAGAVEDATLALTVPGVVRFTVPPRWRPTHVGSKPRRWLRVRLARGDYGGAIHRPRIRRVRFAYKWPLPAISALELRVHQRGGPSPPDAVAVDETLAPPGKPFLPFGPQPAFNATVQIGNAEALQKDGAQVRVHVDLLNPRGPLDEAPPLPTSSPSPDVEIAWEALTDGGWVELGKGRRAPDHDFLDPYVMRRPDPSGALTGRADGTVTVESRYPHAWAWWRRWAPRPPASRSEVARMGPRKETVEPVDGRWSFDPATLGTFEPGLHVLRCHSESPPRSAWAPLVIGDAPPLVSIDLAPYRAVTRAASVELRGTASAGGRATVVLANGADEYPPLPADRFAMTVRLAPGENNILVLVRDARLEPVGFRIVTIVRDPKASPNLADGSFAFTRTGDVFLRVPNGPARAAVAGTESCWVRARVGRGDYGRPEHYVLVRDEEGKASYEPRPSTVAPPSIAGLTIDYDWRPAATPTAVRTSNDFRVEERDPTSRFTPFTPPTERRPGLYAGFDAPFENDTMTLFVDAAEARYSPTAPGAFTRAEAAADPPRVAWEYRTAAGWKRLAGRDETDGLRLRGRVEFVGPADLVRTTLFGREAAWLRAHWEEGVYEAPPRITALRTNTTWASHGSTLPVEVIGSSTGEAEQSMPVTQTPVLPGQQLEVQEGREPPPAEAARIVAEEGEDAVRPGADGEVWVRWHQVRDLAESGPRDRHYLLDRVGGIVRFGDGRFGLIPPEGGSNVRMTYRTGGGPVGNRPAGNLTQLKTAVAYVESVVNRHEAGGGAGAEDVESIRRRGPRTLRHRDRAIAAMDFADLAFEAFPGVARSRGIGATGIEDSGQVTLVIVPVSTDARPAPTIALVDTVREYIEARLLPTVDVTVIGPEWLEVGVDVTVVPTALEHASEVAAAVTAAIHAFLHPLTGGADGHGWEFDRAPHRSDFFRLIETLDGVDHISSLNVDVGGTPQGTFLVASGTHRVTVEGGDV